MEFDKELVLAYLALQQPADRIACFKSTRASFLRMLPESVRQQKDDDQLIWRLFQLRKSGQLPAIGKAK
jgi:hypothetical protein